MYFNAQNSLDQTCRTRFLALLGTNDENFNLPVDWLEEDINDANDDLHERS